MLKQHTCLTSSESESDLMYPANFSRTSYGRVQRYRYTAGCLWWHHQPVALNHRSNEPRHSICQMLIGGIGGIFPDLPDGSQLGMLSHICLRHESVGAGPNNVRKAMSLATQRPRKKRNNKGRNCLTSLLPSNLGIL